MATRKVTITLEQEQLDAIRKLAALGRTKSVSGFVQHSVTIALADVAGWGAMLGQALHATGGPLTRKEKAWADRMLKTNPHPKRKRRAA